MEWGVLDQATVEGPVFSTVKPTEAIFDNMLEITSPGALPDGTTPEDAPEVTTEVTMEVTTEVGPEVRLVSVVDGEMSSKQRYRLTSKGRGI